MKINSAIKIALISIIASVLLSGMTSLAYPAEKYMYDLDALAKKAADNIKKAQAKLEEEEKAKVDKVREEQARQHFEQGDLYNSQGKYREAIAEWQKAINITKDAEMAQHVKKTKDESAKQRRLEEERKKKEVEAKKQQEAEALRRKQAQEKQTLQEKERILSALYSKAEKLYANKDYAQAKSALNSLITEEANPRGPYTEKAKRYFKKINDALDKQAQELEKKRQQIAQERAKEAKKEAEERARRLKEESAKQKALEEQAKKKQQQQEAEALRRKQAQEKQAQELEKKRQQIAQERAKEAKKEAEERARRLKEESAKQRRLDEERTKKQQQQEAEALRRKQAQEKQAQELEKKRQQIAQERAKEAARQEQERLKKLFDNAKSLYGKGKYTEAISAFNDVIAAEDSLQGKYSKDSQYYLGKIQDKMKKK